MFPYKPYRSCRHAQSPAKAIQDSDHIKLLHHKYFNNIRKKVQLYFFAFCHEFALCIQFDCQFIIF